MAALSRFGTLKGCCFCGITARGFTGECKSQYHRCFEMWAMCPQNVAFRRTTERGKVSLFISPPNSIDVQHDIEYNQSHEPLYKDDCSKSWNR